jgi:exodeoxyribonuclease V alpha subunit
VHRFVRTDPAGRKAPDSGYAELTLAMRTGDNPGAVFDALTARGHIRLHPDVPALQEALAGIAATSSARGQRPAIVTDSRESVAALNAAIRGALIAAGHVDDNCVVTTLAGQRIGVGDRIATRRNDRYLGVANRDTWTVTAVGGRGGLLVTPEVTPAGPAQAPVTPHGAGPCVLPADYVATHVELAYAATAHGVQGDTVPAAHLAIGESTGAASAYVGMTRGREANTAHLIAPDLEDAREQWIAVFARDRADLGPAHAAQLAAAEAARYAPPRPLEQVLAELRAAWSDEQHDLKLLAALEPERDTLRQVVALETPHVGELANLTAARDHTARVAERAQQAVQASAAVLVAQADQVRDALFTRWNSERDAASAAARVIRDGPGRLGLRRGAVTRAAEQLVAWADRWRPNVPSLPTDLKEVAGVAGWFDDRDAVWHAFTTSARGAIAQAHPQHAQLYANAQVAQAALEQARHDLTDARAERDQRRAPFGLLAWTPDPAGRLADLEHDIASTRQQLTDTQARIATLTAEPALHGQPADRLTRERDTWQARRYTERQQRQRERTPPPEESVYRRHMHEEHHARSTGRPGHGIGR